MSHAGELAALATAVCWTVTAMAFESAGRRVGSLAVNMIRLCLGLAFLSLYTWIFRGMPLPTDATLHAWIWLSVSGVVGFALGDLFLFRAFVLIGSRISMLIMASVPPLTALIGWLLMDETLTATHWIGMALTIGGIAGVVVERDPSGSGGGGASPHGESSAERRGTGNAAATPPARRARPLAGVLLAFGGALGQAVGLVFSKYGMGAYDAFAATQIRAIAGIASFALIFIVIRAWGRMGDALRDGAAMKRISLGAFFGPFLGVAFSLLAVQHTATGVAATIMSIVPVLIIPPAVFFFREKVTFREAVGAVIAVAGVAIMFR